MKAPQIGRSRCSPVSGLRSFATPSTPVSSGANSSTTYGVRKSMFSVLLRPLEHDLRGAELVAAVHDRHARGELGEEERLLHRGVAAADDHGRLVLVERGVAGRAVGHAAAAELLLAGHAELLVLGAHREDDRAGLVLLVVDPHRVRLALGARLDLGDVVGDEARAEALRLVAELLHHLRPHDPLGVAGVVLDVGRLLEQPAPEEALDDERVQVRAGGVERRGVARRTASDDDDLLDVRHVLGLLPGQSCLTSVCIV